MYITLKNNGKLNELCHSPLYQNLRSDYWRTGLLINVLVLMAHLFCRPPLSQSRVQECGLLIFEMTTACAVHKVIFQDQVEYLFQELANLANFSDQPEQLFSFATMASYLVPALYT